MLPAPQHCFDCAKMQGLSGDEDTFMSRYESAHKAVEACHPAQHHEATRLLERVKRELSSDQESLAGEVYRSLTHAEQSDEVLALAALRVAALSVDLWR